MNKETSATAYTLSIAQANLYGMLLFIPVIGLGLIYLFIWRNHPQATTVNLTGSMAIMALAVMVLGIVAHELIHGFSWIYFGKKPYAAIKFGFMWKTLSPYAHCNEAMPVQAYRWGVLMPGLLLGIFPYVVALLSGNFALAIFGLFFIMAAGGDTLILWLLREVDDNTLVADHPSEVGCLVYE